MFFGWHWERIFAALVVGRLSVTWLSKWPRVPRNCWSRCRIEDGHFILRIGPLCLFWRLR